METEVEIIGMKIKKSCQLLLIIGAIILSQAILAVAQKPKECKLKGDYGGKYKKGVVTRTLERPKEPSFLMLHISISPENFNREYLLALAKRIRDKYCKEPRIQVQIFDEHRAAKTLEYIHYLDNENTPLRGFYRLNRESGEELIIFSTVRGRSRTELMIFLSKNESQKP